MKHQSITEHYQMSINLTTIRVFLPDPRINPRTFDPKNEDMNVLTKDVPGIKLTMALSEFQRMSEEFDRQQEEKHMRYNDSRLHNAWMEYKMLLELLR